MRENHEQRPQKVEILEMYSGLLMRKDDAFEVLSKKKKERQRFHEMKTAKQISFTVEGDMSLGIFV